MEFVARLKELCAEGDRRDAVALAKANLGSAREVEVTIDGSTVRVETEHFRGTHRWHRDARGEVVIEGTGEYTCTDADVDLSFSTASMNETARDRARAAIEAEMEGEVEDRSSAVVEDGGRDRPADGSATSGPGESTDGDRSLVGRVREWFRSR